MRDNDIINRRLATLSAHLQSRNSSEPFQVGTAVRTQPYLMTTPISMILEKYESVASALSMDRVSLVRATHSTISVFHATCMSRTLQGAAPPIHNTARVLLIVYAASSHS